MTLVLDYALLSRERVKRTNKCSSTNKWSRVWCVWRGVNGTRVPLQCDCAPLCPFAPHHALWYSLRSYTQSGTGGAWRCVSLGSVYVAARVGAVCLLACVIACGLCEVPGGAQLRLALACGWCGEALRNPSRSARGVA